MKGTRAHTRARGGSRGNAAPARVSRVSAHLLTLCSRIRSTDTKLPHARRTRPLVHSPKYRKFGRAPSAADVGMSGLPPRLKIRGQQILYPDGTPALLRGMNVMFELDSEYAFPRADTDDLLFELLPGTNLLRLVMLRWDDRPTRTKNGDGNDCSAGNLHSGRSIQSRCIEQFKDILRWCGPMAHAQYPMPQQPGLPPTTPPKPRRARKPGASVGGYGRSSRHGLVWRRAK